MERNTPNGGTEIEEDKSLYKISEERIPSLSESCSLSPRIISLVRPNEEWCSCGKWQDFKYPCRHALAYINHTDPYLPFEIVVLKYTHDYYKAKSLHGLYSKNIVPVIMDHIRFDGETEPPTILKQTGHPCKKRKRFRSRYISPQESTIKCSMCKEQGHNKRTCPTMKCKGT